MYYNILSLISVYHLKPDFTLWLIQKYFDLLVCQINIWTANCERAAVKPQKQLEPPNPMSNVLPAWGPDTFYFMCFDISNDDTIS